MRVSTHNVGGLLAVFAGCMSIAMAIWPGAAPQSQSLNFWLPLAVVAGSAFLLAAIIVDRHELIARALLLIGGFSLIASGIYFGMVAGGGARSALALVADLAPGILAVLAGVTIGRFRHHAMP